MQNRHSLIKSRLTDFNIIYSDFKCFYTVKNWVKLHGNKIKTVIFSTVSGCPVSICQWLISDISLPHASDLCWTAAVTVRAMQCNYTYLTRWTVLKFTVPLTAVGLAVGCRAERRPKESCYIRTKGRHIAHHSLIKRGLCRARPRRNALCLRRRTSKFTLSVHSEPADSPLVDTRIREPVADWWAGGLVRRNIGT